MISQTHAGLHKRGSVLDSTTRKCMKQDVPSEDREIEMGGLSADDSAAHRAGCSDHLGNAKSPPAVETGR